MVKVAPSRDVYLGDFDAKSSHMRSAWDGWDSGNAPSRPYLERKDMSLARSESASGTAGGAGVTSEEEDKSTGSDCGMSERAQKATEGGRRLAEGASRSTESLSALIEIAFAMTESVSETIGVADVDFQPFLPSSEPDEEGWYSTLSWVHMPRSLYSWASNVRGLADTRSLER